MAITYVGGVTGQRVGSTYLGITLSLTSLTGGSGSTALEGDLVVIAVSTGSTTNRAIGTSTAGYTNLTAQYISDTYDTNLQVSYKFMGATPDTSVITKPSLSAADGISATVMVFRGVDTTTPLDVSAVYASGINTGRPTPGAITPTTSGSIVVCMAGGAGATTSNFTNSDLSNFITIKSSDTNDSVTGMGWYGWSSGTFTPAQWLGNSNTTSDSWCACTIALRPIIVLKRIFLTT